MANTKDVSRRGGKKGRKRGRNYRWGGRSDNSVTKYRARHNIGPGSRKQRHAARECRLHTKA